MAAESIAPLITIVGPTASGKTALAIELAQKYRGEIICADSRTIYKEMDIGTAKPNAGERQRVPHWGLDLVTPGEVFTVADFKQYATQKITEIRSRGHLPILAGGSGLYVDSVLFDFQFGGAANTGERQQLERLSLEELHRYCHENNVPLPENGSNKRYVIRSIERKAISGKRRPKPLSKTIIVGIATDNSILRQRISARSEQIFDDGIVDEAIKLGKKYGWNNEAMTGNIYPLIRRYVDNELTLDEVKERFVILDRRLAKRQMTWLRRNPFVEWCLVTEAARFVEGALASEYNL